MIMIYLPSCSQLNRALIFRVVFRRVITVAGEVLGPDGILLAEAEAVLVEVEPSFFGEAELSESNWRVYPDDHPVKDEVESHGAIELGNTGEVDNDH